MNIWYNEALMVSYKGERKEQCMCVCAELKIQVSLNIHGVLISGLALWISNSADAQVPYIKCCAFCMGPTYLPLYFK